MADKEKDIELRFLANALKLKNELSSLTDTMSQTKRAVMLVADNMKQLLDVMIKATNKTDDYVTSMKLLNTVFSETKGQASGFVKSLSEMSGLDETRLARQVSLFGQLGQSLNIDQVNAEKFAEKLTILSTKMSMLYNIDMTKMSRSLQRAVQGTQTTLKSLTGIEVTDTAKQVLLTNYGISKQVSELNEAEKAIVTYATILQRVGNSNEFYANTVNSVAWQKKVLTAQVQRLAVAFGNMLYPILAKILPILNGILMVITEIISMIAKLFGYSVDTTGAVGDLAEGFNDLGAGVAKAGKAIKKELRTFDKLNNLTTPSAGGSGGGILGAFADNSILGLLDRISNNFLDIKNKATEIRDRVMEWLGFEKQVDSVTGEVSWKLKEGYTNLEKIRDIIIGIGVVIGSLGIVKLIGTVSKGVKVLAGAGELGALATGFETLGTSILGLLGVAEAGTFAAIATGVGAVAIAVGAVVAGVVAYNHASDEAKFKTDQLIETTSATRDRLLPVQEAFQKLRDVIIEANDYDGLALTEEQKNRILNSINDLLNAMKVALDDYNKTQLKNLNEAYYELHTINKEEYEKGKKELAQFNEDKLEEIDKYGEEQKRITQEMFDEQGNLIHSKYIDYLADQSKFETDFLGSLAETAEDERKINDMADRIERDRELLEYQRKIKHGLEIKNLAIEEANKLYDRKVESINKMKKLTDEEREQKLKEAEKTRDGTIRNAEMEYNQLYNLCVKYNKDVYKEIDAKTGEQKSLWTKFWDMLIDKADKSLGNVQRKWNNLTFTPKTATLDVNTSALQHLPVNQYADGGFPTKGEVFVAREDGAEMVGQINGHTAVANNNDIVAGIQSGVFSAMMSALSVQDFGAKVTIEASGDDAGLLNFIDFKQKQRNRQFN